MIDHIRNETSHSTRRICVVLNLARSSYYHAQKPTARQLEDAELADRIERIFRSHKSRYGYRRIVEELADEGVACSDERARRLMKRRSLVAIQPKTFVPRTSDGRADKPSPNLVNQEGLPQRPNAVLAGDITHIPTAQGWVYLAVVIDLYTRKIVGWKLETHMRAELVTDALKQAIITQSIHPGAVFHSDRGSQYGSRHFRELLSRHQLRQSMSGRANPYDNAWTESVIGTIKNEMLQGGCFRNIDDARVELFDYIESYYNIRRKHSSLSYLSPFQYENRYYLN